jgi:hypothetical protein
MGRRVAAHWPTKDLMLSVIKKNAVLDDPQVQELLLAIQFFSARMVAGHVQQLLDAHAGRWRLSHLAVRRR